MGNALLEIISFGRRAGEHAAKQRKSRGHKKISIDHISNLRSLGLDLDLYDRVVRDFKKIDPKQIKNLASEILNENKLTLVIAGPGYLLKQQLMNLATVEVIESRRE